MKRSFKTVCCSGYFDPLHIGHIEYLKNAKLLGDKLVVILNNDAWDERRKAKASLRGGTALGDHGLSVTQNRCARKVWCASRLEWRLRWFGAPSGSLQSARDACTSAGRLWRATESLLAAIRSMLLLRLFL